MSTRFARRLLFSFAGALALGAPAFAQSSADDQNRSNNAQPENQTTSDSQQSENQSAYQSNSQEPEQSSSQNSEQDAQSRQAGQDDSRGLFDRADESRRAERQEDRQGRRQEGGRFTNRDRQPAIGVTVVERGGMGVRVMGVVPDSPASQAGIRPGDTILEVEGRRVDTAQQLVALIQDQEAGDTAEFAVIREGREYQVPVRLATRESALPARLRRQDGSQDQNQQYGQSNQPWQPENWQQGQSSAGQQTQYDQQRQFSQNQNQGQYDRRQYNQQYGQDQYQQGRQSDDRNQFQQGRSSFGPPHPPSPYTGAYNQDASSNRQASWGDEGSGYSQQGQSDQRGQLGDRLVQRISQFEQRLERLTQRLEQIERSGGVRFQAGATESRASTTDESHDSDDHHDDEEKHDDENQ